MKGEYSFVIHTRDPVLFAQDEIYIEIAVGLGETLASGGIKGQPYRIKVKEQNVTILSYANFSTQFAEECNIVDYS